MDPFACQLQPLIIEEFPTVVTNMVKFFIHGNEEKDETLRATIKDQFVAFHTQGKDKQGTDWNSFFDHVLPPPPADPSEAQRSFDISRVSKWLKETGGYSSRLRFFQFYARGKELYIHVAKRLLSMCTEGLISVERVAKPLKNKVMSDERNRLGDESAEVLLRAGINLHFLYHAKSELKVAAAKEGKGMFCVVVIICFTFI